MSSKSNEKKAQQEFSQNVGVPYVELDNRPDIIAGDIISYAGDKYQVLETHGNSGKVVEYPIKKDSTVVDPFYWNFAGEKCLIIGYAGGKYRADFEHGDIIEFLGTQFEVVVNFGTNGLVKYPSDKTGENVFEYEWALGGHRCHKISNKKTPNN